MRRLALLSLLVACAADPATPSTESEVVDAADDASPNDATPPTTPVCETRTLEVVPQATGLLGSGVYTVESLSPAGLQRSTRVDLLVGPDYPDRWTGTLAGTWYARCGQLTGRFELDDVPPGDAAVALRAVDATLLEVSVSAPGRVEAEVRGVYVAPETPDDRCAEFFPPGSRTPFVEQVTIVAETPRAVQWTRPYPCPEGRFAAPEGAFLQGLVASPTDAAGEAVYPSNTAPNASLPVEVTACAASAFDWPEPPAGALPGLQLPDTRGTVRLEASVGEPLDVEVVGADRVTSVEVAFALAGVGGGSGAVAHESELGATGWGRVARYVVPGVTALRDGAAVLCGAPPAYWFTLEAGPPEVCEVRRELPAAGFVLPEGALNTGVYLNADGRCRMSLSAPGFRGGAGFTQVVEATFLRVDGLHDP
jgi:hypothetical protein